MFVLLYTTRRPYGNFYFNCNIKLIRYENGKIIKKQFKKNSYKINTGCFHILEYIER